MPETATIYGKIVLDIAQITHAGGRASNQDALSQARHGDLACFIVSDGVGGEQGGEVASRTIVDSVIDSFSQKAAFTPRSLQAYVEQAAARLAERKSGEACLSAMSATVAVLLIEQSGGAALWAHMGDTRIYLFRANAVWRVTKDHSLVQQLVDAGYCRPDQLRRHPHRSTLCAAIGVDGSAEITEAPIMLQAGDAFLICTDGFWEWVTEKDMEQAAAAAASAEEWLAMMRDAVENKGRIAPVPADNYTAFAIHVAGVKQ